MLFGPKGVKNNKNGCISGTTRPIQLKFWEQVVETVPLVPYEVHLPQNPSHSARKRVSNGAGQLKNFSPGMGLVTLHT